MKILQVITRSETIGGAQKYVLDLSVEFTKRGHDVTVVSAMGGEFSKTLESHDIKFIELITLQRAFSPLNDLLSIFHLRKVIKALEPDIIALHSVKAGLIGRLAAIGLSKRVYFTAHGWSHIRNATKNTKLIYKYLERSLSLLSEKVICVSKSDLNFAIKEIGIEKSRCCCIRNGVKPTDVVTADDGKKLDNRILRLLSVVRYQAPKDFETLLYGLSKSKNENWELKILGDGDDKEQVQELIDSLGLSDRIKLLGFQRNIGAYYREADAIVLISKSEGLPMSLLEGMSFALPVIGSNVGGIPELIRDGYNGFLIGEGDFQKLADSVDILCENKRELVVKMGRRSKFLFDAEFTFDIMYESLTQLFFEHRNQESRHK